MFVLLLSAQIWGARALARGSLVCGRGGRVVLLVFSGVCCSRRDRLVGIVEVEARHVVHELVKRAHIFRKVPVWDLVRKVFL